MPNLVASGYYDEARRCAACGFIEYAKPQIRKLGIPYDPNELVDGLTPQQRAGKLGAMKRWSSKTLAKSDRIEIKRRHEQGETLQRISLDYDVGVSTIQRIISDERHKAAKLAAVDAMDIRERYAERGVS